MFPAFTCANNTGSLINSLFGVKIFNPVPLFFSRSFNYTLSVIVSCDGNRTDNGDDDDPGLNNFSEDIRFVGVLSLFFSISLKKFIDCYEVTKYFI